MEPCLVCNMLRTAANWFRYDRTASRSIYYYYYSVVCLTTGPKPLPKRFLHIVRSKASSFKWEYPLLSLRSSSSFLRLLPRLLVTSISPFILPSITCFRRQFLRKMWPIQLAFRFRISLRIFPCSLTRSNYAIHTVENWALWFLYGSPCTLIFYVYSRLVLFVSDFR